MIISFAEMSHQLTTKLFTVSLEVSDSITYMRNSVMHANTRVCVVKVTQRFCMSVNTDISTCMVSRKAISGKSNKCGQSKRFQIQTSTYLFVPFSIHRKYFLTSWQCIFEKICSSNAAIICYLPYDDDHFSNCKCLC